MNSASSSSRPPPPPPPMETQFSSTLPPLVGRSHHRTLSQIPRRERTQREHSSTNFLVSTRPAGTSTTTATAGVNVVRNSKKPKIYTLEDSIAADTLIMMSQDHRKINKVHQKNDVEAIDGDQQVLTAATTTLENSSEVVDWKIDKTLFESDVNANDRLLLSKDTVERDILASMDPDLAELCRSPAGTEFQVLDVDDCSSHRLRLKKHTASSGSFVFVGQWRKKFVKRKGLKAGDRVGLTWANGKFLLKLLNKKRNKGN